MPLLEAEPNIYPPTLFTDPPTGPNGEARWWVLYTHARSEKALARHLHARQITFYLPLHRNDWTRSGRDRTSYLPLFPGYVFLHGDDDARIAALESNLLAATIPVGDQERLFNDLIRVERLLGGNVPVAAEVEFSHGTPVMIDTGPFKGLQGTVIHRGKQTRFVVEVEFLRQGVSVEVDGWALRRLSPAPSSDHASTSHPSHR